MTSCARRGEQRSQGRRERLKESLWNERLVTMTTDLGVEVAEGKTLHRTQWGRKRERIRKWGKYEMSTVRLHPVWGDKYGRGRYRRRTNKTSRL